MKEILYPALVMGGLGLLFGLLLAYASKKFYVPVDEKQIKVRAALPGANCGGCGYPGCDAYAEAVAQGEAKITACAVGGADLTAKLAEILGVEASIEEPKVAFVKCKGTPDKTKNNGIYYGQMDCREAVVVPGRGPVSCQFGCLGLGTCVAVCNFDAIHIENGIAQVDEDKCVGCGACVSACPKNVIDLVPKKSKVRVQCNSPLKGAQVRQVCEVGCIGCTMCVKACPKQAISMNEGVAVIDYTQCVNCGLCGKKCPTGNIINLRILAKKAAEAKSA